MIDDEMDDRLNHSIGPNDADHDARWPKLACKRIHKMVTG